jgi:apolipoprotein N-acyltransferase
LIVNASNLGWFHDNPQLARQFLAIQQQYAAEFRLPVVLATNSGLSAIVSSNGTILKQSPSQAPHVIRYDGP